jgi:hypothetical protein
MLARILTAIVGAYLFVVLVEIDNRRMVRDAQKRTGR